MKKKKSRKASMEITAGDVRKEQFRRKMEGISTFGLLVLAVGLLVPFTNLTDPGFVGAFKWVYAAGALIYTSGRVAGARDKSESMRLRRLRRLEFWAGIAFCIAAFFWFYNSERMGAWLSFGGATLAVMRETILFTLVGAFIQIIASWMIYFREKKESGGSNS